ncbi:MAG: L-histidine N(alpha)-methyltransferase [Gemmatimonadota bacterium]
MSSTRTAPAIEIRRHRPVQDRHAALAADVRAGLTAVPKELPPKYFYDARGSRLFERITRLPEYYLTRTERWILRRIAPELVAALRPAALVEFGSGSPDKAQLLLDAMEASGLLRGYAPLDVSESSLREAIRHLTGVYPGLEVVGVIGDFEHPLPLPFEEEPRLVAFLGSTIGNLETADAREFLRGVSRELRPGDGFLIGFDLVKEKERLEAAYNDAAGVTAAFNRNVLRVLNRELGADFDLSAFRHRARYNAEEARIEMYLLSERRQEVHFPTLELTVSFREGEMVRTELSHKYTRRSAEVLLGRAELRVERWDTDPAELFALALARLDGKR